MEHEEPEPSLSELLERRHRKLIKTIRKLKSEIFQIRHEELIVIGKLKGRRCRVCPK